MNLISLKNRLLARFAVVRQPGFPAVAKAAQQFKRELLLGNDDALREMAHVYAESWRRLNIQLKAVTREIRAAKKAGVKVSPKWLMNQERYQILIADTERELGKFAARAIPIISNEQDRAIVAGIDSSLKQMQMALGPVPPEVARAGLSVTWHRVPHEALKNLVGAVGGKSLEYKFAGMTEEVKRGVKDTFATGFARGWNPTKIAKAIHSEFDGVLANVLTTCRTECLRAYRLAGHETAQANQDILKGWIWSAAKQSSTTCLACWAMDGTEHPMNEMMTDHPNGKCSQLFQTKTYQELFSDIDMSGIKETGVKPWDSEEAFRKLSTGDQKKIMGAARYEAWKDGKVGLHDMAVKEKSRKWGDHYRPKTLQEMEVSVDETA